jgi:hypothetical protein
MGIIGHLCDAHRSGSCERRTNRQLAEARSRRPRLTVVGRQRPSRAAVDVSPKADESPTRRALPFRDRAGR